MQQHQCIILRSPKLLRLKIFALISFRFFLPFQISNHHMIEIFIFYPFANGYEIFFSKFHRVAKK